MAKLALVSKGDRSDRENVVTGDATVSADIKLGNRRVASVRVSLTNELLTLEIGESTAVKVITKNIDTIRAGEQNSNDLGRESRRGIWRS